MGKRLSYNAAMKRKLDEMVIAITGASAGIGYDLARRLAARGAHLSLAARRVDRLEAFIAEQGTQHLATRCDVSHDADCQAFIDRTIERYGRIDTLICNAGYADPATVAQTTHQQMEEVFRTNVFGTTDCIRAAVPHMLTQPVRDGVRGQIMIVSSAAARRGLPYFGAYAATKAAQLSLAEALRVELSPQRIAVSSVHPISTQTDFFSSAYARTPVRLDTRNRKRQRQPAAVVAQAMLRGIERPRAEIWTSLPTRVALSLTALFPQLGDFIMNRMCREIEELNQNAAPVK